MLPVRNHPLSGKKILIPPMAYGSTRAYASVFRAIGLDADLTPPSDSRTIELGSRYTSGDECYPAKVTIGDFFKALEAPGADPSRIAFFMPTAEGPCRFGLYAPYLRSILDANGYRDVMVLSPTSDNSYAGLGDLAGQFTRSGWRALLSADILQKLLLRHRPHETERGSAQATYMESLQDLCDSIERSPTKPGPQLAAMHDSLVRSRDRFRALRIRRDPDMPVIGIVGEIFCRLNTFSNDDLIRRLEEYGAEAWLSDIAEWVWYTNAEQFRKLRLAGRLWSKDGLIAVLRRTSAAWKNRASRRCSTSRGPTCRRTEHSVRWC
jgi:predicted nucleotide-binding protein (sugar kinase/HSP70/actin superfamily)